MADNAGNAAPSWRDIYALKSANVDNNSSGMLTSLAFRSLLNQSAAPVGSSVPKYIPYSGNDQTTTDNVKNSALDAAYQKGGFEGFQASAAKVAQTPVIKQVLDALSVGTYSTANFANDALGGVEKLGQGDASGLLDIAASPLTGVAKGASAAFGNENDVKTWGDIIKRGQGDLGLDTENDAAKWTQGVGGFIGDVALDPLTYASFGATGAVKAASKGFVEGGKGAALKAAAAVKDAEAAGSSVDPALKAIADNSGNAGLVNRLVQAKGQGSDAYKKWMQEEAGGKPVKFGNPFAKSTNPDTADAIAPTTVGGDIENQMDNLLPKEPATVGADGRTFVPDGFTPKAGGYDMPSAPAPVKEQLALEQLPIKVGGDGTAVAPNRFNSPQVAEEEKNIADGLTEASKAADANIIPTVAKDSDGLKAVADAVNDAPIVDTVAKATAKPVADTLHEGMTNVMKDVKFSKPVYGPSTLKNHADAHAASLPQTIEREAPVAVAPKAAPKAKAGKFETVHPYDAVLKDLKNTPRKFTQGVTGKISYGKLAESIQDGIVKHPLGAKLPPQSVQYLHDVPEDILKRHGFAKDEKGKLSYKAEEAKAPIGKPVDSSVSGAEHVAAPKEVVTPRTFSHADFKADLARRAAGGEGGADNALKNGLIGYMVKGKAQRVHPRVIQRDYEKAVLQSPEAGRAVLSRIDPSYTKQFFKGGEKVAPKAAEVVKEAPKVEEPIAQQIEKITEEVPGTPIDFNHPSLSKIAEEHRGLSTDELKGLTAPTKNVQDMQRYINDTATDAEVAHMIENMGLPKASTRSEVSKAFGEQYATWRKRNSDAVIKAASKPETAREAVGEANQATAQLVDKVPMDQTLIRRARRAIDSNMAMSAPLPGIKSEFLKLDDIQKLPERAVNEGIKTQAALDKKNKMDGGAVSDTPNPLTGSAIYSDKWGTMSAISMHGSLVRDIRGIANDYTKASGLKMSAYAMMNLYRRGMDSAMANLRAMGIAPYLDLGKSIKTGHVNLGMDDISSILFKDAETRFFAGKAKGIQPQAFMTGVEALVHGKAAGKTVEEISNDIYHAFVGDKAIYRGKYKDAEGIIRGINDEKIVGYIKGFDPEGKATGFGFEGAVKAGTMNAKGDVIKSMAESRKAYEAGLKDTADRWAKDDILYQNLSNRMIVNAKEHGAEIGQVVDRVSKETMAEVAAKAASPMSQGDFIAGMEKAMKEGRDKLGPADETKYMLWDTEMNRQRALIMKEGEQKTVRTAKVVSKEAATPAVAPKEVPKVEAVKAEPKTIPAVKQGPNIQVKTDAILKAQVRKEEVFHLANTKNVDDATRDAKAAIEEDKAVNDLPPEMYDVYGGAVSIDAWRRIHPISSFFNTKFGLDASAMDRAIGTGLHTQVRMQSIFHGGVMEYLAKNPGRLMEDWKTIQNEALMHVKGDGKALGEFIPSTDSSKELYNMINSVFDISKDNIMTRNGIGARHFNEVARSKGLKMEMDESPETSILTNSRAWTQVEGLKETSDVLEFLSKAHAVSTNVINDISIASNFARTFGSAVPKEGHALLSWTNRGKGKMGAIEKQAGFFDLLPKTLHYSTEASRDIANIHRVMNEARSIKSTGAIGSFMTNVFNPVTNLLKAGQTIVRPGHWVNNTLGDVMRNYLAGVNSIAPYRHGVGIMKAGGAEMKIFGENPLEAYKWHKELSNGEFEVHGRGDGVVVHIGGKPQKVSYESMYKLMQDGPVMQKHHGGGVAEDFMSAEPGSLNKFGKGLEHVQHQILDNNMLSLNNLAAQRDNFSRLALAVDFAQKGKFKDIHDLKAGMEGHVSKWIPTSTDFTAKEAKYVRPAFMYYTWLRGITPRIVDTLMNKPGVALLPSKAMYEAAKANGVDPMSIGNPFPPNAQMPSYYYNNVIGPLMQGEGRSLWGFNIANPVTDVMDQLGAGITPGGIANGENAGSILKTALSSASPFAKIPIDLATQQSNGVPIKDNVQYMQDALGGSYGGLLSKMSGKLINGQGRTDTANGAAHGVDQGDVASLQIANFLSGLKITDYQSPGALRSYKGEIQGKKTQAQSDARRNF